MDLASNASTLACHACRKTLAITPPVGRREACPFCGADLRCCLNCTFYAPEAYNACREPQAERVLAKERANACDLFRFAERGAGAPGPGETARGRLDALFRKP